MCSSSQLDYTRIVMEPARVESIVKPLTCSKSNYRGLRTVNFEVFYNQMFLLDLSCFTVGAHSGAKP